MALQCDGVVLALVAEQRTEGLVPRRDALDEATEGLAPLVVAEIWRVIAQVRTTGISTLIVDRNYQSVLSHTDVAVIMEKGKIALTGESATLLNAPDKLSRYLGV